MRRCAFSSSLGPCEQRLCATVSHGLLSGTHAAPAAHAASRPAEALQAAWRMWCVRRNSCVACLFARTVELVEIPPRTPRVSERLPTLPPSLSSAPPLFSSHAVPSWLCFQARLRCLLLCAALLLLAAPASGSCPTGSSVPIQCRSGLATFRPGSKAPIDMFAIRACPQPAPAMRGADALRRDGRQLLLCVCASLCSVPQHHNCIHRHRQQHQPGNRGRLPELSDVPGHLLSRLWLLHKLPS